MVDIKKMLDQDLYGLLDIELTATEQEVQQLILFHNLKNKI